MGTQPGCPVCRHPAKPEELRRHSASVVGMGAKDAVYLLERKGLRVRLNGVGKVRSQSIPGGSRLVRGQTISLTLH